MKKDDKATFNQAATKRHQDGLSAPHYASSWRWPLLWLLGTAAWIAIVQDDPFFWDTVQLGSKHAHHFYENNLRWGVLPTEIDSGHPPVFGYYLAIVWALFGKTLAYSHWAMYPFVAGTALLLYRLGLRLGGQTWAPALVILVFVDPVVAGQSALIGPDIPLAFFFLLAVEAFLSGRRAWAMFAILGLCSISMRGMMTAGALFLWQTCLIYSANRSHLLVKLSQTTLTFLPGVTFALWFLYWHQEATGWTGFHVDSPWARAFEPARGIALAKNLLVLGWRWVDFGRVFEWIAFAIALTAMARRMARQDGNSARRGWSGTNLVQLGKYLFRQNEFRVLALLAICLVLFLSPSALLYSNLSAHRYFLPGFLAVHLLFFHLLSVADLPKSLKTALFSLLLIGHGTGNCWIYPQGVATGWDATLAHRPYHKLRAEMLRFIEQENIPIEDIGTAFPNINKGAYLLLNGDQRSFVRKDFSGNRFVLISNVFNDFSKKEHRHLQQEWILLNHLEHAGVWLELYQKRKVN